MNKVCKAFEVFVTNTVIYIIKSIMYRLQAL